MAYSQKHIAILYTGGTIGMTATPKGYAPMPDFAAFLKGVLPTSAELPAWTLHAYPDPIDSTNATPADWQRIGRDIAARYTDFDGFVVLHGTDTMAYTASALSFMLQSLDKPVVLTGSQAPLGLVRSDALQNLVSALQVAASNILSEVAICFNGRLLRGNRATKISAERFAAFDSPRYPHLAELGIHVTWNRPALLSAISQPECAFPEYSSGRIWSLRCVPGMSIELLRLLLSQQPQALILECFGAGNMPDRDPTMIDLLADASERGVVLVACSQSLHGSVQLGAYATGSSLLRADVTGAGDMTFEAIFTKLHHLFALGLSPDDVRRALVQPLRGEIS